MNLALFSIAGYVLLLIIISAIHTHKQKRFNSTEDFLIADRRLSGSMSAFSIIASIIGGGTILTNSALTFKYGWYIVPFLSAFPLSILLFGFIAPKIHTKAKKEKWLTLYDFFQSRHGSIAKNIVAVLQIISIALMASVALIGGAKMLQILVGYNYNVSVILMAAIVGTYLVISGFSAVIKTDMIQAVFILVLFGALLAFTLIQPLPNIPYESMNFEKMPIIICILMTIMGLLFAFGSEDIFQRVYATKNKKALRKAFTTTFILYVFFYACLAGSVFRFRALYPHITGDMAFLESINLIIPPSFQWLAAIAILSVLLSTIDTVVFNGVLNINKLIMDLKGTGADHKTLTRRIRLGVPVFLLFVVSISLFIQSVVQTTFIYAVLNVCNAFIIVLSFLFPKLDKWHVISILVINLTSVIAFVSFLGISEKITIVPFCSVPLGCLIGYIAKRIYTKKKRSELIA